MRHGTTTNRQAGRLPRSIRHADVRRPTRTTLSPGSGPGDDKRQQSGPDQWQHQGAPARAMQEAWAYYEGTQRRVGLRLRPDRTADRPATNYIIYIGNSCTTTVAGRPDRRSDPRDALEGPAARRHERISGRNDGPDALIIGRHGLEPRASPFDLGTGSTTREQWPLRGRVVPLHVPSSKDITTYTMDVLDHELPGRLRRRR